MVDLHDRAEAVAYVAALEEMVVRLACNFRRADIDRRQILGTIRREAAEGAFRHIQAASPIGRALDEISQIILTAAKVEAIELAAVEARYRTRNNPGPAMNRAKRPLKG